MLLVAPKEGRGPHRQGPRGHAYGVQRAAVGDTSRPRVASSAAGRSTAATAPRRRPLCTCCCAANASSLLRKSASAAGARGLRDSRKFSARFALTIAETLDNTPRLGRSDSNQSSPRSIQAPTQPVPSRRARSPAGRAGGGGIGAARAMGGATGGVIGGACWARHSRSMASRCCRVNHSGRSRVNVIRLIRENPARLAHSLCSQ